MSDQARYDAERNALVAERKVRGSGNSTVITIPPQVLDAANIGPEDSVEVSADLDADGEIVLRKIKDAE